MNKIRILFTDTLIEPLHFYFKLLSLILFCQQSPIHLPLSLRLEVEVFLAIIIKTQTKEQWGRG